MCKNRGKIGPFTDKKGKIIEKEPAKILQDQYKEMWNLPK